MQIPVCHMGIICTVEDDVSYMDTEQAQFCHLLVLVQALRE
jgi:hypothetical protein